MLDLRMIDDLVRRLGESLPPGVNQTREELERRLRNTLTAAFERMNLVGREEFDAKCRQLEAAQARLAALEERLEQLENG